MVLIKCCYYYYYFFFQTKRRGFKSNATALLLLLVTVSASWCWQLISVHAAAAEKQSRGNKNRRAVEERKEEKKYGGIEFRKTLDDAAAAAVRVRVSTRSSARPFRSNVTAKLHFINYIKNTQGVVFSLLFSLYVSRNISFPFHHPCPAIPKHAL